MQSVSNDIKPEPIKDHGTVVILLGDDEAQDTMRAPAKAKMPRKWALRYLNERFLGIGKSGYGHPRYGARVV